MDEKKYKQNQELIDKTKEMLRELGSKMLEDRIVNPALLLLGFVFTEGVDRMCECIKENTEYDCKVGTLSKLTENLMKDQAS